MIGTTIVVHKLWHIIDKRNQVSTILHTFNIIKYLLRILCYSDTLYQMLCIKTVYLQHSTMPYAEKLTVYFTSSKQKLFQINSSDFKFNIYSMNDCNMFHC